MKIIINANTEIKRVKGLMFHRPITKDECALFTMERCGQHVFWNKNVDFPISLIFCNQKKEVKDVMFLKANQTDFIKPSSYDIMYVVEAHFESPKKYNIFKGKKMQINGGEVLFV